MAELVDLLRKLHETFIALAAQLHQVHEAVKVDIQILFFLPPPPLINTNINNSSNKVT